MILVTGGTGLVGSHLLAHLAMQGNSVRAIFRENSDLDQVKKVCSYYKAAPGQLYKKINWIKADLLDLPALEEAFKDIVKVYHCAALISFKESDYKAMRKINIEGTANIVNCCLAFGIKKLCFVSSISAIGKPTNLSKLINEECQFNINEQTFGYAISKYGAETEVWRGSQEGLDVVIVNPGIIIGAGFYNSGSGRLFSQIYKGFKFYTKGKSGYISVEDVAQIMIKLMEGPNKNERYILVSENLSYKKVLDNIADELGKKRPQIHANRTLTGLVWRIGWLLKLVLGIEPRLNAWSARSAHSTSLYNNQKIKQALNYDFEPISLSIKKTCQAFLEEQV